jgi:hypothetical protein
MTTYRAYVSKNFGEDAIRRIGVANQIIEEYQTKGYTLTLRQLYYQHVARGLIANNLAEYSRLGALINDGRLAGMISWHAIEDRTRNLIGLNTYADPADLLRSVEGNYRIDLWENQPWRPEVWVEKEALADVVGKICNQLRVDFFACRGYVSQSEQWRAGRRLMSYVLKGQRPIVFHLGDHDPSGIDMTRDNEERLTMFAGTPITVVRLALNMEQVQRYRPPPNPAKVTDSRFEGYQKKFGDESWELDALNPEVIHDLIESNVRRVREQKLWDAALAREVADKQALSDMICEIGG